MMRGERRLSEAIDHNFSAGDEKSYRKNALRLMLT